MSAEDAEALPNTSGVYVGDRDVRFEVATARNTTGASEPANCLIVKSLSWHTTDDSLGAHFEGCTGARVLTDRDTGKSKG